MRELKYNVRRPDLCAGLGRRQVDVWGNSETLFRQTVTATRDNYLAYNNLGFYYSNQGRTEEALTEYRKSLAINPQYPDALNNMGHALAAQRRHAEAIPGQLVDTELCTLFLDLE